LRQILSKGVVAVAAATGILSLCGSSALADSVTGGGGKGSPGVVAGKEAQAPATVPDSACGADTCAAASDTAGGAKPTEHGGPYGDAGPGTSSDGSYGDAGGDDESGHGSVGHLAAGPSLGPSADDSAAGSSGVGSDTEETSPADVPVDDSDSGYGETPGYGKTPSRYGEETPSGYGDTPSGYGDTPPEYGETPPGYGETPPPTHTVPPTHTPPPAHTPSPTHTPPPAHTSPPSHEHPPSLPETGSRAVALLAASGVSAVLIAGGVLLYRRGRGASHR
jgi:LPXTG-motif cell wall-anchored protein